MSFVPCSPNMVAERTVCTQVYSGRFRGSASGDPVYSFCDGKTVPKIAMEQTPMDKNEYMLKVLIKGGMQEGETSTGAASSGASPRTANTTDSQKKMRMKTITIPSTEMKRAAAARVVAAERAKRESRSEFGRSTGRTKEE